MIDEEPTMHRYPMGGVACWFCGQRASFLMLVGTGGYREVVHIGDVIGGDPACAYGRMPRWLMQYRKEEARHRLRVLARMSA